MTQTTDRRTVLVLRPWLAFVSGGDAYAHFDGLVMHRTEGHPSRCYGDYRVIGQGNDGRKTRAIA